MVHMAMDWFACGVLRQKASVVRAELCGNSIPARNRGRLAGCQLSAEIGLLINISNCLG